MDEALVQQANGQLHKIGLEPPRYAEWIATWPHGDPERNTIRQAARLAPKVISPSSDEGRAAEGEFQAMSRVQAFPRALDSAAKVKPRCKLQCERRAWREADQNLGALRAAETPNPTRYRRSYRIRRCAAPNGRFPAARGKQGGEVKADGRGNRAVRNREAGTHEQTQNS